MLLNGAQIVIECIKEQGADTVFGYPGGAALELYDALYGARADLRHILATHEQHAAHAADGYARATGKTGIVISTSGPGATNLLTGLAASYMDSTPVVAITCNVENALIGKDSFQEVDIFGISMPITKHNFMVKDVHNLASVLRDAFRIAAGGRPGPVLVDILQDVLRAQCEYTPKRPAEAAYGDIDAVDLAAAAALIDEAQRPLICAGGGVAGAHAEKELFAFAHRINAPVALTLMGIGAYPADDGLYAGMLGMFGTAASARLIDEADLLIAIGCRFSDRTAPDPSGFAKNAKILHIDIDPAEINKNKAADISLIADAKQALALFNRMVAPRGQSALLPIEKDVPAAEATRPCAVMRALGAAAGENAIFTTEVGEHQIWAARYLPVCGTRRFITSGGLGSMGFGLGAAIGAAAGTGKTVINIAGDGSFLMNMAELSTAAVYGLPIVELVMNNGSLGLVRQMQLRLFSGRYSEVDMARGLDMAALAAAFGIGYYRLEKAEEAEALFKTALAGQKPCLIECMIDEDEPA